jgi:hypothetical protein
VATKASEEDLIDHALRAGLFGLAQGFLEFFFRYRSETLPLRRLFKADTEFRQNIGTPDIFLWSSSTLARAVFFRLA